MKVLSFVSFLLLTVGSVLGAFRNENRIIEVRFDGSNRVVHTISFREVLELRRKSRRPLSERSPRYALGPLPSGEYIHLDLSALVLGGVFSTETAYKNRIITLSVKGSPKVEAPPKGKNSARNKRKKEKNKLRKKFLRQEAEKAAVEAKEENDDLEVQYSVLPGAPGGPREAAYDYVEDENQPGSRV